MKKCRTSRVAYSTFLCVFTVLMLAWPLTGSADAGLNRQVAAAANNPSHGMMVLHVYFSDTAERDQLANEYDAANVNIQDGYLTVLGDRALYDSLVQRGLRVEIEKELASPAIQANATTAQQSGDTFDGGYHTVEGVQSFLDTKVAAYPSLAEKVDFGDSWCKSHADSCVTPEPNNGYDLWALHITNHAVSGPKPVFWFDTAMHSEELATTEVSLRFIDWLLDGYSTNADAHWLVDYTDIWIVPLVNPDGRHISEAGGDQPYPQRKNADTDAGCTSYPPTSQNQLGVDLNRNFPFEWGCCRGASAQPCNQAFRGPRAGSEDETQAVMTLLERLLPAQSGKDHKTEAAPLTTSGIVQSMHSYANRDLYPWGWTDTPAPNYADLNNIAAHMSSSDTGGNGYQYCAIDATDCLYTADGDAIDWVYGQLGVAAFTTELEGNDEENFFPPFEKIDDIWNNNRNMLVYMAKIARTPYLLTRGPDADIVDVEPQMVNAGSIPNISATINSNWANNTYKQPIGGAEYYVDTPPWAGGTAYPMLASDGGFDGQVEQVQAQINTAGLASGQHIIFVRGRGTADYSGNQSWGPTSAIFLQIVPTGGTPVPSPPPVPPTTTASVASATPTAQSASTAIAIPTVSQLPPPAQLPGSGSRTFPETGKTVSGIFLDYWNNNGGLAQQGYPISDVFEEVSSLDGKPYTVQYFERAVFEYHPENAGTAYEILLSQLGTFRLQQKYPQGAPGQVPNTTQGSVLFPETGKHLGGTFLQYWQQNGGLTQQGYPISDEFTEKSDLDGKEYTVQYFERAVFEAHPETQAPYNVLLSQLGTFQLREKGLMP